MDEQMIADIADALAKLPCRDTQGISVGFHDLDIMRRREAARAIASVIAGKVAELTALVAALAPEAPMNDDEQGGCVWCGGSSGMWRRKHGDMYAGSDPRDHDKECPWVKARAALSPYPERRHD